MRILNRKYRSYWWKAKTVYSIHSPLVYRLIQASLESDKMYYAFIRLEQHIRRIHPEKWPQSHRLFKHLKWIFHWIQIIKPSTVHILGQCPELVKWFVQDIHHTVICSAVLSQIPTSGSLIICNETIDSDLLATITQSTTDCTIVVFCKEDGCNKVPYEKLGSYLLDFFDLQLWIKRSDILNPQRLSIIEHRYKRLANPFF